MPIIYNNRKTKRLQPGQKEGSGKGIKRAKKIIDEEISSDSDFDDDLAASKVHDVRDEQFEDIEEKAEREAKKLLKSLNIVTDAVEEPVVEEGALDVAKAIRSGTRYKDIADSIQISKDRAITYRPHRFAPLCIAPNAKGNIVYSCGKENTLVKYDTVNKKKLITVSAKSNPKFHKYGIQCLAVDPFGKYLATGGSEGIIKIWNLETLEFVSNLLGHSAAVTSLVFRLGVEGQLFSGSEDRSIRYWDTKQMGYVDIMYGHTSLVGKIDVLHRPRILTCGTRDQSVRIFKVGEDSQLLFNPHVEAMSVDTVCFVDANTFVSGAIDGSISIWNIAKKKPVLIQKNAHANGKFLGNEGAWITAIAAVPYSNLLVSGSNNGVINFWKLAKDNKKLNLIESYEVEGFVNDIKFSENGDTAYFAVGKDHKLGRWSVIQTAKNHILVLPLKPIEQDESEEDDESEDGNSTIELSD
uniref:WD_REPEATS_REGION domain-containing protein n=1 Tax=Rhabditophanes sp. KR3021 TaxID=114890 RepID=A0AC35THA9_9BILA